MEVVLKEQNVHGRAITLGQVIIRKAGLLETIQDNGRWGYQGQGLTVAGAMDRYAYQLGNVLLANPREAASLEITLVGPQLEFSQPSSIVVTGADLSPHLNGQRLPLWQVTPVYSGDLLTFKAAKSGCRAYLAIKGGFQVPVLLGSRSTYIKGQLGGIEGRALQQGDALPYLACPIQGKTRFPSLAPAYKPNYKDELFWLRVVLGPHQDRFTADGLHTFLETTYRLSTQSDRMGMRLEGEAITHSHGADILSAGTPLGAIQVPANGQPIILMADRQTTGGYTIIACVISTDLDQLAQARPGQKVRFQAVSVEEAQALYREREQFFSVIEKTVKHLDFDSY